MRQHVRSETARGEKGEGIAILVEQLNRAGIGLRNIDRSIKNLAEQRVAAFRADQTRGDVPQQTGVLQFARNGLGILVPLRLTGSKVTDYAHGGGHG